MSIFGDKVAPYGIADPEMYQSSNFIGPALPAQAPAPEMAMSPQLASIHNAVAKAMTVGTALQMEEMENRRSNPASGLETEQEAVRAQRQIARQTIVEELRNAAKQAEEMRKQGMLTEIEWAKLSLAINKAQMQQDQWEGEMGFRYRQQAHQEGMDKIKQLAADSDRMFKQGMSVRQQVVGEDVTERREARADKQEKRAERGQKFSEDVTKERLDLERQRLAQMIEQSNRTQRHQILAEIGRNPLYNPRPMQTGIQRSGPLIEFGASRALNDFQAALGAFSAGMAKFGAAKSLFGGMQKEADADTAGEKDKDMVAAQVRKDEDDAAWKAGPPGGWPATRQRDEFSVLDMIPEEPATFEQMPQEGIENIKGPDTTKPRESLGAIPAGTRSGFDYAVEGNRAMAAERESEIKEFDAANKAVKKAEYEKKLRTDPMTQLEAAGMIDKNGIGLLRRKGINASPGVVFDAASFGERMRGTDPAAVQIRDSLAEMYTTSGRSYGRRSEQRATKLLQRVLERRDKTAADLIKNYEQKIGEKIPPHYSHQTREMKEILKKASAIRWAPYPSNVDLQDSELLKLLSGEAQRRLGLVTEEELRRR